MTSNPTGVRCGNRKAHGLDTVYHADSAAVKACYAASGRFGGTPTTSQVETAQQIFEQVEATRRPVADPTMVAPTFDQFMEWNEFFDGELTRDQAYARYQAYLGTFPSTSVEALVTKIRGRQVVAEAERTARFAAWGRIPVGNGDKANYALETSEGVVLYQIQRPSTGKYQGKTYVKRHSGEGLVRIPREEAWQVMDRIAADPMAAAVLYGRTATRCAICHRKLTDDVNKGTDGLTSLQRGIGPKCAKRVRG
jgi:hypothetical protein